MQRQQAAAIGWKLRVYDVVTVAALFLVTLAFRESLPLWWPFDFVQGNEPALKAVRFGDLVHLLPWVVLGCAAVFFTLACWGYDPQRGFGGLTKRGGGA